MLPMTVVRLRYVMNLRCYRRRHVCTEWPEIGGAIVTGREQHGFVTVAYTLTDPPRGSTGPGGRSLVSAIALGFFLFVVPRGRISWQSAGLSF